MKRWWTFAKWVLGTPWPAYAFSMLQANLIGALFVFGFLRFILPPATVLELEGYKTLNQALFLGYLVGAFLAGAFISFWLIQPVLVWQRRGAGTAEQARRRALRIPVLQAATHAVIWGIGVIIFVSVNAAISTQLAVVVGITSVLGGTGVCLLTYLQAERMLRPIAAFAMSHGIPAGVQLPGVYRRLLISGSLATGIPLFAILVVVSIERFGYFNTSGTRFLDAMIILVVTALVIGAFTLTLVAAAIVDPLHQLQEALKSVQRGDFTAKVRIYDATEIGLLQARFNKMVNGLAERQQLRDLFGRYVGADVARRALEHGSNLGGEERQVGVLFVDLIGSTNLALRHQPAAVVDLLNRFFNLVVDVVDRHGGFVNKFQGDAALAIFGAPLDIDDPAGRALAAARELRMHLPALVHLGYGIGVAFGTAIAGHVGHAQRLEYTVIGDPVNEAARLTDLAKNTNTRLLASGYAYLNAGPAEACHWGPDEAVQLRGRDRVTRLVTPTNLPYALER